MTLSFLPSNVVYRQSAVSEGRYLEYAAKRDSVTAWPALNDSSRTSWHTRPSKSFPEQSNQPCIQVFGDSFAWGEEVSADHAWPEILAKDLQCPVENYGVGGFGTDQALLRQKQYGKAKSAIEILTFIPENIIRNVNQFRDLIYPSEGLGFKPRFVSQSDSHKISKIDFYPANYFEYQAAIADPGKYLENEYFLPGGLSGLQENNFPYTPKVIKAFGHYHVKAKILSRPRYAEFYSTYHSSNALITTALIAKDFQENAKKLEQKSYFVILPMCDEFDYQVRSGQRPVEQLLKLLDRYSISYIDVYQDISATWLEGEAFKDLFMRCDGHYNEKGNMEVASIIARHLNLD